MFHGKGGFRRFILALMIISAVGRILKALAYGYAGTYRYQLKVAKMKNGASQWEKEFEAKRQDVKLSQLKNHPLIAMLEKVEKAQEASKQSAGSGNKYSYSAGNVGMPSAFRESILNDLRQKGFGGL